MEGRSNSLKLIITKLHKVFTEHIMSCARAADEFLSIVLVGVAWNASKHEV